MHLGMSGVIPWTSWYTRDVCGYTMDLEGVISVPCVQVSSASIFDWLSSFKIPTQFSLKTMSALKGENKMDITKAVRCEIVSSIATLVMVHTIEPTPEQLTSLAQRLISQYPILKDNYGCGYVSNYLSKFLLKP